MAKLTQERLKELLHYDPDTGIFTWEVDRNNQIEAGNKAGTINNRGYQTIGIDGKVYKASRLAWLYIYGYFPENDIDHINRIRDDNRIENLRHVSRQCNMRNSKIYNNNTSGVTGVIWEMTTLNSGKWRAYIQPDKKLIHLGYFDDLIDAATARWEAEKKYNFPNCQTTSSAYLYLKENKCIKKKKI